jgi:hypothetical protein
MQQEIAEGIVEGAAVEGVELRFQPKYSGRGMYGRETTAIVAEDMGSFMVGLARFCGDLDPCEQDREIEETVHEVQALRTDSMGRGIVLY